MLRRTKFDQFFTLPHTCRQQRNDWKHVLERINHRHKCHYTHAQRIVVSTLEDDFIFQ